LRNAKKSETRESRSGDRNSFPLKIIPDDDDGAAAAAAAAAAASRGERRPSPRRGSPFEQEFLLR
jgi:hypothetical protein